MGYGKPRCSICKMGFYPDARVGKRQRTCGAPECRKEQKRRTQSRWSKANSEYWVARRITAKVASLEQEQTEGTRTPLLGAPPPADMGKFPWDLAQESFGAQGAVIIAFFVRLLLRTRQDAIKGQPAENKGESPKVPPLAVQDAIKGQPVGNKGESPKVPPPAAQDATDLSPSRGHDDG